MDETAIRESVITEVRQPSQISWGAIFAGWVLAASVALLLYQVGAAIGLTVIDPAKDEEVVTRGFSYGAGFWVVLTWVVSLFLGGLFAARLAARPDKTVGMLHGMTVWGVTIIATLLLGAAGIAGIARGGASLISGGVSLGASAASAASSSGSGGSQTSLGLEAEIKQSISQTLAGAGGGNVPQATINQAMNQLDGPTLAAISGRLLRGDTEGAKNMIALRTNLGRADVDKVVNGLSAKLPQYKEQVQQAAQQATRYSAALLWMMVVSMLIGLGAAVIGGSMGSRSAERAYRRGY